MADNFMRFFTPPLHIRSLHRLQQKDYLSISSDTIGSVKAKIGRLTSGSPKVTVALIAHNEEKNLFGCLASLSETIVDYPIEIVVVNNASTDGTGKIINDLGVLGVYEERKGYGFARQRGLDEARGKIVITGDADTLYGPHWVEEMTKPLRNDQFTCTTSLHGSLSEDDKYSAGLIIYQYIKLATWLLKKRNRPHLNCGGASMAYRKEDALRAGGYKMDGSRGEDGELAFNLLKLGQIKLLTSKHAMIYTSMRRVEADGGLFKAFMIRLKYRLKHLDSFLYPDRKGN